METLTFAVLAILILGFGFVSERIQKTIISPPMVFVVFGLLVGNHVLGLVELDAGDEFLNILAELTLVLVLFTDASRIDLNVVRREHKLSIRLLGLG